MSSDETNSESAGSRSHPEGNPQRGTLKELEDSIGRLMPLVGRVLASAWNIQMRLLIAIGLMPYAQKYPWALFVLAFVLLGVVFPLGLIFTATGIAALNYDVRAKDQFLADLDKRA
ncbi:hypothetical protein LB553_08840 [Mesorhizobium sp. CA8]|uniref:hypothetical protein n=1 Tax=Mesorhizobium sp. CA8 TaxID=2876637 RepID=UPI001CCCB89A|nr:hypothetical protein [Mesorhizobium sp. CA8]MBZ9760982.1 hypothetical protein [Mesorhizobium sp. CA8]